MADQSLDKFNDPASYGDKLYQACTNGDLQYVESQLSLGADPDHMDNPFGGWTLLHAACANNKPEVVKMLIHFKANVQAVDRKKYTPLHIACSYGYMDCIRAFRAEMAKVLALDSHDEDTVSPLEVAADQERIDVVKYLISEFRVQPSGQGTTDKILKFCCEKKDVAFVRVLINDHQYTPQASKEDVFSLACETGDLSLAQSMVKEFESTPKPDNLVCACEKGHLEIVNYLLADLNCDPNEQSMFGQTPLTVAKERKVIQLLLKHGAAAKDAYSYHRKSLGLIFSQNPLENPVKVFVLGHGGEGKSTLIEAMQHEKAKKASQVSGVSQHTAGIIPKIFESAIYGNVQFFDFAGQEAFHSSHSAVIKSSVLTCPPVFILVTGLHRDDEQTKKTVSYWLDIIANQCDKVEGKIPLVVVGSHEDQVMSETVVKKERIVSRAVERYLQFDFIGFISMDCRYPKSQGMTKLRKSVGSACGSIREKLSVSINSHMFFIYLLDKHRDQISLTLEQIQATIKADHEFSRSSKLFNSYQPQ